MLIRRVGCPQPSHRSQNHRRFSPAWRPRARHRRNHAKGICFTGVFDSNGNGAVLSSSQIFTRGQYPALGRFNLATPNANAADAMVRVRGLGLQISAPNGEVWRSAMIDPPFFPVATVEGFYALQLASKSKDPSAMGTFAAAHPEIKAFGGWAKSAPWTGSYAEEPYKSLDSFIFTDESGAKRAVRWSYIPQAQAVPITQAELSKRGPNYLEQEIAERVGRAPQRWTLMLTVADPSDQTVDPSKAWPKGRRTIKAGELVVQRIEAEADGPCGMLTSIRRSCQTASPSPMIRFRPLAPPHMRSPTTPVRRRPSIIRIRNRVRTHEHRPSAFHRSSARAALADGTLPSRNALHRRWHGLDSYAEICTFACNT